MKCYVGYTLNLAHFVYRILLHLLIHSELVSFVCAKYIFITNMYRFQPKDKKREPNGNLLHAVLRLQAAAVRLLNSTEIFL